MVAIKGMKMPSCCAECPLEIDGRCGGLCGEDLPRDFRGWEDRPRFCPLEEDKNVHGKWEVVDAEEPRRYGCSICKVLVWHESNYCPNCGAQMDGEV